MKDAIIVFIVLLLLLLLISLFGGSIRYGPSATIAGFYQPPAGAGSRSKAVSENLAKLMGATPEGFFQEPREKEPVPAEHTNPVPPVVSTAVAEGFQAEQEEEATTGGVEAFVEGGEYAAFHKNMERSNVL